MQLTNTRPLADGSVGNGQTLRRNASGILAGDNIFRAGMDNKLALPHE